MPHIAVDVNNMRVTTVNLTPMRVVGVSVHGAIDRALKAAVNAMGGNYEEGGCGHVNWLIGTPGAGVDTRRATRDCDQR